MQSSGAQLTTGGMLLLAFFLACHECDQAEAFVIPFFSARQPSAGPSFVAASSRSCRYMSSSFYEDFEEYADDDDDDDDYEDTIDPDSLGDWRDFRRNLAQSVSTSDEEDEDEQRAPARTSVSKENEEVLSSQNKELAEEYKNGVWAHEVSTVRL